MINSVLSKLSIVLSYLKAFLKGFLFSLFEASQCQEIRLVQGSRTHQLYMLFLDKKALTSLDVREAFPDMKPNHIGKYMTLLVEKGLIVKSKKRHQSPTRKDSRFHLCISLEILLNFYQKN